MKLPLLVLAAWYCTAVSFAQLPKSNEESCRAMLQHAFRQHYREPEGDAAMRRVYQIRIVADSMGHLDTSSFRLTVTASKNTAWIQGEHFEVRSDESYAVRVDNIARVLNVADTRRQRRMTAAQQRLNKILPDSLMMNARMIECAMDDDTGEFRFVVDPARQRFYNADTVMASVNRDGEFSRLMIVHPRSSVVRSTEYLLLEIDMKVHDSSFEQPVLSAFFGANGELRQEYAGYRVERR